MDRDKIMAYIPKEHEKYDVLPKCRRDGGEVFSYPSRIVDELGKKLPDGENLIPYGYSSMEEYIKKMEDYAAEYFKEDSDKQLFAQFKSLVNEMNRKEEWSIVKYIGETDDNLFGLTHGHTYYWPCSKNNPRYDGVIDDEEFTSYWYATEPTDWEILLDSTGMANATIFGDAKEHASRAQYEDVMAQIERMMKE